MSWQFLICFFKSIRSLYVGKKAGLEGRPPAYGRQSLYVSLGGEMVCSGPLYNYMLPTLIGRIEYLKWLKKIFIFNGISL